MARDRSHPNYLAVWFWLVGLMVASVVVSYLPFSKPAILLVIFTIAGVKAILVALNYMHLKFEQLLIYCMAIVPLVLFFILTVVLFPDIALH